MINVSHEGKTVLVTGGAGGIGVSVCEAFALSKANVIVNYRSHDEESEMFVKSLADKYKIKAIGAKGDLSKVDDISKIFDKAQDEFGSVDILINCAGKQATGNFMDITVEEWEESFKSNITAVFLASQEFAKRNIAQKKGGHIINFLSKSAFYPTSKNNVYYVVNKTGEVGLTRALAVELVEYGIYVNAIIPGFVDTKMIHNQGKERADSLLKRAPLHRFTKPEELAEAIAIITDDDGKMLVGSIVDLSGGIMLGY